MLLLLALSSSQALTLPSSATTRRSVLAAAPALFAPLAANAVGANKVGYACRGDEDCGVSEGAVAALTATPGSWGAASQGARLR